MNQHPFVILVDQILAARQQPPFIPPSIRGKGGYSFAKWGNKEADTSALERQIDEMVYKLYDLTPEEIAEVKMEINYSEKAVKQIKKIHKGDSRQEAYHD